MPSTPKSRPDAKNTIYITENIAVVSPSTASGFGAGGAAALASGVELHFPTVSGNIIFASGANIIVSGSQLAIPVLHISGQLILTSGTPIRSSGTSLIIYPQITTAAITSGAIINSPTISGIFQGGMSGTFDNLRVNNTLTVGVSGLFEESFVDMKQISTPSDPLSGHANVYIKAIDSTNDGLYTKIRVGDTISETLVAPIGLAGTAVNTVVSGRFSGQQLWLSGASIMSSGSGLSIAPAIHTAVVHISSNLLLLSGATITTSGSGITFANTVTTTTGVFQSVIVSGSLIGNSGVFDTLQISSNLMINGFQNHNYVVWRETDTYKARNLSGIIQFSGTNATTVLQNCLKSGMSVALSPHISGYPLVTPLFFSGSSITLRGATYGFTTSLRLDSSFSAIIIPPGTNYSLIEDLTVNVAFSGYLSSMIVVRGGTTTSTQIKNVLLNNPVTPAVAALDTMTGNGIELDDTSGALYRNKFQNITVIGGKNAIYAELTSGITFMNDNDFFGLYANSNTNGVYVKSAVGGQFQNNAFTQCRFQATSGSHTFFDLNTEMSGNAFFTRHVDCMAWDVAGFGIISGTYGLFSNLANLDLFGCHPTWLVMGSGAVNRIHRTDYYTIQRGTVTLTNGDGVATEFLVSHGMNKVWTPIIESLVPATSGARGNYFVNNTTSGNANSFIVSYATAPANLASMKFDYVVKLQ